MSGSMDDLAGIAAEALRRGRAERGGGDGRIEPATVTKAVHQCRARPDRLARYRRRRRADRGETGRVPARRHAGTTCGMVSASIR